MQKSRTSVKVNYIQYGNGTKDIVLLHGWGQNIEMMKPLGNGLQDRFRITILDLPGFGESEEPREAWTIYDYVACLEELLQELKIKKPILMGHSFGGRVSIAYASYHPVDKLVLFGSPCIEEDKTKNLKVKMLKRIKKLPGMEKLAEKAKKYIGSTDYKQASPIMRQTLVNVVNQDLSEEAKKIMVPTLLVWGDQDTEAPLEKAQALEKIMTDAGLVVLPGCTHYAYLEALPQVLNILTKFL